MTTEGAVDAALLDRIAVLKSRLDVQRPLHPGLLPSLQKYYDVELTYTSNAIEGNTLTLSETAEVIEHGITVGGKRLREHLEAQDHYDALIWMRTLAAATTPFDELTVTELHRRIVARSQPDIAGIYSRFPRRVANSTAIFPNPAKVPALMATYGAWLTDLSTSPGRAFEAHHRLTSIHPFGDGNGRTARLLMNLLLLRGGYPPVTVRPEDRRSYLAALERVYHEDDKPFQILMHERLAATLDEYLATFDAMDEQA